MNEKKTLNTFILGWENKNKIKNLLIAMNKLTKCKKSFYNCIGEGKGSIHHGKNWP